MADRSLTQITFVTPGLPRRWAAFSEGAGHCDVAKKSQAPDQVRGDGEGIGGAAHG
jgi:hypothetical protein